MSILNKFTKKRVAWGALIIFVVMQVFRIDQSNPVSDPQSELLNMYAAEESVQAKLKGACYDCHSNHTTYPWYANIAPVSWWIKGHVKNGRRHLNFSEWASYDEGKRDHKLEECIEMVENQFMPLTTYVLGHSDAKMTEQERQQMIDWFASLR